MFGGIDMNLRALKESRGFLKILQMFLAMLVFSTAVSSVFDVTYSIKCTEKDIQNFQVTLEYPFKQDDTNKKHSFHSCETPSTTHDFMLNLKDPSLSRFHVFMAVAAFLYSLAVLIYFVFFELDITQPGADRHQVIFYTVDMAFSLFVSALGLIACFCFMSVSTTLSYYASSKNFINDLGAFCTTTPSHCNVTNQYNHSNIISSILFQLVHIGVWGFSLYMMWKDQVWKPVTSMPYDQDPSNPTAQNYGSGFGGNDYDYTYQS